MFNNGFGASNNPGDFEAMARQYWSAWGQLMRQGAAAGPSTAQPPPNQWQQAVDWWSQLMPDGRSQANDAVGRFNQQASQWFGQMQQVAAQFAGQDSNAADISQAWRRAMGAHAENPLPDLFKAMRGQGANGMDEWLDQVKPYLQGFQQQTQRWQQLPAFGQYREHQERWQALQLAQQEYQQQTEAFNALMMKCGQDAFGIFEDKLTAHEEPGRQITSARGLFDLWIDSAEQAYSAIALSPEFREVYGALTNAQMRLRTAIQREVEHMTNMFGMPTRTEIDSAHRKIADLERALRRAAAANAKPVAERKAAFVATHNNAMDSANPAPTSKARRTAGKRTVARTSAPRKSVVKTTPAKKSAARKISAKPAVMKQAVMKQKVVKAIKSTTATSEATAPARVRTLSGNPVSPGKLKKTVASGKAATNKSPSARTPVASTNRVVSMKDWVARYAAQNTPDAIGPNKAGQKKKAGK